MRPCSQCVLLVMLFCASAQAGFVIKLESKELAPNTPNQTVDIFLEFHADPASLPGGYEPGVRKVLIGAFLGDSKTVNTLLPGETSLSQHRGTEGNFQKGNLDYPDGISQNHSGSFWQPGDTATNQGMVYGYNVAQVTFEVPQPSGGNLYRDIPAAGAKIGSFHIDTTGIFEGSVKLSLDDPTRFDDQHDFLTSNPLLRTAVYARPTSDRTDPWWIPVSLPDSTSEADPDRLTFEPVTFNISSTPEPSVIGFAGLGLAAGAGWLRARKRRRKATS